MLSTELPLIVIVGPTAAGKTEASIQLAERLNGAIVSADSRLFYRGMDIGTAKPFPEDMRRVPHFLVDIAEPDETLSLALFQERAHQAIAQIHAASRLPFLVGGTGQYIRAVIQGWNPPVVEPDPRLRSALQRWAGEIGAQELHFRLEVLDPPAANQIDYRNLRRTIRALEVIFTTGRRFSDQRQSTPSPYHLLILGINRPRPELYARIDARIQTMLEAGFVQEVQSLLNRGYSPELPSLSAIGYREVIAYLHGDLTLDEAVTQIRRSTRTFVRRQANWFKADDPQICWFQAGPQTIAEMEKVIQEWLAKR